MSGEPGIALFCKYGNLIYPRKSESAVSFRDVARHFGTYRCVIHEHPDGDITKQSVTDVENQLVSSGKIQL
jgi:hypothetical protein